MASTILSDNGVSSGSAGIKTTADSTGALALQTTTAAGAATTAVTISTSQVVTLANALPVASGGTGVTTSTGTGAVVLGTSPTLTTPALGTPASADFTTIAATQAQQEAATAVTAPVTPGRQQYHPSAAKAWVMFDPAATINASYNVSSITDLGTGTWRVVFTNAQSSATFSTVVCAESSSDVWGQVYPAGARTTTYVGVGTVLGNRTLFDPSYIYAQIFGDLP